MTEDTEEATVEPVVEGETFPWTFSTGGTTTAEVGPSCGESFGRWYCVTHEQISNNNLMHTSHCRDGYHRIAWLCEYHGPEAP